MSSNDYSNLGNTNIVCKKLLIQSSERGKRNFIHYLDVKSISLFCGKTSSNTQFIDYSC